MKKLLLFVFFLAPLFVIAQPCATWNSVSTTNLLCNGDSSGALTLSATATAMPITYSITGMTSGSNTSGSFTGLPAGFYNITASDANNCSVTSVLSVMEPNALVITSVTTTVPSCVPGSDGSACINASGGTPFYFYTLGGISPAQTQPSNCFNNLPAGTYSATVTDANGCSGSTSFSVTTPLGPSNIIVTGLNTNPCDPDTISVIATPGSSPTLTYSVAPSLTQSSPGTFIIPNAGVYTVTATDSNGCSVSTLYTSTANGPQLISSQTVQPSCGATNGGITVNANWTNTAFTYLLNPGNITSTSGIYTNLGAGTYTVSAQSANCTIALNTFTLSSTLNPYPITVTQNSFTATAPTNGTPPYVYRLNGQIIPLPQSGLRCTGTDTFSITDAGNCTFDTVFNFTSGNSFPGITLNKNITDASCTISGNGQIIYAPTSPLTYNWIANAAVVGNTSNPLTNLNAGLYVVELHNAAGDCIYDSSSVGTVGTNCGDISGTAFYDTLVNCIYDTGEIPLSNVLVTLTPGNLQTMTNAAGYYEFLGLPYGNYEVEVDTNTSLNHYPTCNLIQYDTLSALANNWTNDFPHDYFTSTVDLYTYGYNANLVPASPLQSVGRDHRIYYGYNPYTTTPIDINLYLVVDSIKHYDTASVPHTAIMGDTIMWTMTNISPWNLLTVYYDSLQGLPINHVIPVKFWVSPISPIAGNSPVNDTDNSSLIIATSYDPNDKQVSPQGEGSQGYIDPIDHELSYIVRFQNTGTAMAYTVAIEDTISNRLDINTLQVLGSSHNYLIEKDNNLIRFVFNNIMLPDSNADEPNSHGFIQYSIQQEEGNVPGDVINNTAHIYFDYNPAIVTNTTINTIRFPVQVEEITRSDRFKVYPNPTSGALYVQELQGQTVQNITLKDIMGRSVAIKTKRTSDQLIELNIENAASGIYFLLLDNETVKLLKE